MFAIPTIIISIISIIIVGYVIIKYNNEIIAADAKRMAFSSPFLTNKLPSIMATILCLIFGLYFVFKLLTDAIPGYFGIIITGGVLIILTILIKMYISIKNNTLIKNSEDQNIYIRDIPSKYSPAIISYLYNQKLENKKDIAATILNLCSKKIVSFEKDENNNIIFKDLNNTDIYMTNDEKYIYNWITKKSDKDFKFIEWQNVVKEEYNTFGFSKKNKLSLEKILYWTYFIAFVLMLVYVVVFRKEIFETLNFIKYIKPTLVIALGLLIYARAFETIKKVFGIDSDKNSIYTKKGATEIARWEGFKKYMNDFSLVRYAEIESIVVLQRYLAYSMVLGINKSHNELKFDELNEFFEFNLINYIDNYVDTIDNETKK